MKSLIRREHYSIHVNIRHKVMADECPFWIASCLTVRHTDCVYHEGNQCWLSVTQPGFTIKKVRETLNRVKNRTERSQNSGILIEYVPHYYLILDKHQAPYRKRILPQNVKRKKSCEACRPARVVGEQIACRCTQDVCTDRTLLYVLVRTHISIHRYVRVR